MANHLVMGMKSSTTTSQYLSCHYCSPSPNPQIGIAQKFKMCWLFFFERNLLQILLYCTWKRELHTQVRLDGKDTLSLLLHKIGFWFFWVTKFFIICYCYCRCWTEPPSRKTWWLDPADTVACLWKLPNVYSGGWLFKGGL